MDSFIFQQINNLAFKWLLVDVIAIFFAKYFGYILVFFLFLFLFKNFKKYSKMVFSAIISAIFARFIIVEIIRFFYYHPRPFIDNQINLLLTHSNTSSLPSGHAAFFFALSTIVFLFLKRIKPKFWQETSIFYFLSSFLISISRVFCGLHFPFDIFVGFLIGILSGWLIFHLFVSIKLKGRFK